MLIKISAVWLLEKAWPILDFFAVRTTSEVAVLTCSRTEDKHPSVQHCLNLPSPFVASSTSKCILDTAFNHLGSQIATVTDRGYWTVYDLSVRDKIASVIASGDIDLSNLPPAEQRTGWWKIEWTDNPDELIVAESKGLHVLNITVSVIINEANEDPFITDGNDSR
jgi:hypothetical protein